MQAKKIASMIIDLLKEQNKMDLLPQVIQELYKASTPNQAIVVQSANILNIESQKSIEELLESKLGYTPEIDFQVTPELIAGIRIQINDQLIDATIKKRLEEVFKKIH